MAKPKTLAPTAVDFVDTNTTSKSIPEAPAYTPPARKRQITFQLLKKVDNVPVFVKIISQIYTGKAVSGNTGAEKMEPAQIVRVINLPTGEEMEMIVNKALEGTLTETFPKHTYVGKAFEIEQYTIPGKRYKGYKIAELDL